MLLIVFQALPNVSIYICMHVSVCMFACCQFHAAAGYEHVETPVSYGPTMSSTPLVPHSHTPPLHYMTPSVCW